MSAAPVPGLAARAPAGPTPASTYRAADPILQFSDVTKTFPNGTMALTGVDLSVRSGEFVTVVGPSGCGKSTLLRIASGLTKISGGASTVAAERVGYVFQDATLLP